MLATLSHSSSTIPSTQFVHKPVIAAPARRKMQEFHKVEGIIEADNVEGRTSVVKNYHRYPLKFLTVDTARRQTLAESRTAVEEDGAQQQRRRGPLAPIWVYAVTYGGGLVAGDDIGLKFTVRRDAALVLTTQASTKVYKSRSPGRSAQGEDGAAGHLVCHQTLAANVESGALLAIVPHAVTCFADARYKQRQVVRMEEGANLILVDWLTSGRVARGEEWAFESYETTNDVLLDDQLLVREAVRLSVHDGTPTIAEKMRGYNAMATILVVGPDVLAHARAILEGISKLKVNKSKEVPLLCSASPVYRKPLDAASSSSSGHASCGDVVGVMVKIAAKKTSQVTDAIHEHFNGLWQDALGNDPYRL